MLNKNFFLYFPQEDEIIIKYKKYDVRKFFDGQIKFSPQENQQISQFKQQYKVQKEDSFILRMLYATKFKFDKCLQAIQNYDEWRNNSSNIITAPILQLLQQGFIYLHGRDNRFRPIIVVNAKKIAEIKDIEQTLKTMTIFLDYVLDNCMLPGQIENWIVLLDLGTLSMNALPKQDLYKIMNYLSSNYRSRMHKCYVINCSKALTLTWSVIKQFLEDITINKIIFENPPISLLNYANPQQIEIKYGGQNIDKTNNYWPPQEISCDYQINQDVIRLVSEQQYIKLYNEGFLVNNKICQELIQQNQVQQQQNIRVQDDDDGFQSCEDNQ